MISFFDLFSHYGVPSILAVETHCKKKTIVLLVLVSQEMPRPKYMANMGSQVRDIPHI